MSSCLIREENGKQLPVYYVSHVLRNAEIRYPTIEKMVYCLLLASRKLRPYFQGHDINVYTNYPLRKILHKPELSGRLVNWEVELSQFNIAYLPRTSIKGQTLADFLVECPASPVDNADPEAIDPSESQPLLWKLFVDGSTTTNSSGAGVLLISPEGFEIQQSIKFAFPTTNNCSEYEALLAGL